MKGNVESKLIVNVTDRKVVAYNSEGNLIELLPVANIMEYPRNVSNKALLVDESFYKGLSEHDRHLTEYVRIYGEPSTGRDGIEICTLVSWTRKDDDKQPIRIYPASMDLYRTFDSSGIIHHFLDAKK